MTQFENEEKLSVYIRSTNYPPLEWRALDGIKSHSELHDGRGAKALTPKRFEQLLFDYDLSRKQFGEIFGVGESTISGWVNGKGIPSTIGIIFDLALENDLLEEQIRQFSDELDAAQFDPRVVLDGDRYSIIGFDLEGNSGKETGHTSRQPVGKIIARGIPDMHTALSLARSNSLLQTLKKAFEELGANAERREHFEYKYRDEVMAEIKWQLQIDDSAPLLDDNTSDEGGEHA